jgi:hypothetical protein
MLGKGTKSTKNFFKNNKCSRSYILLIKLFFEKKYQFGPFSSTHPNLLSWFKSRYTINRSFLIDTHFSRTFSFKINVFGKTFGRKGPFSIISKNTIPSAGATSRKETYVVDQKIYGYSLFRHICLCMPDK